MQRWIAGAMLTAALGACGVSAAPVKRAVKKPAAKPAPKPAAPAKAPAPEKPAALSPAPADNAAVANAIPPVRASSADEVKAAQLALKAEDLQADRKWPEAAATLQQAAELTPADWVMWDRAGWAWIDAEQPAKALTAFQSARRAAPSETPVGGLLAAEYLLAQNDPFLAALKADPSAAGAGRMLPLITAGVTSKPQTPAWNLGLGVLYARVIRNSFRALGPLEAAAKAMPKNADAWLLLTEANQELNRGAQGDAAAIQYLDLAPETEEAYRLRAERYALQRQVQEAMDEYAAGIAKHPTAAELYFALARLYEKEKAYKSADAIYRKLIAAATSARLPDVVLQGRAQLANFQARQLDFASAEAFYREAAARPEATAATWTTWGSLLAIQGKWDEAATALTTAADRDEKARGAVQPSVRKELLTERYHAAVCRLVAAGKGPGSSSLRASLALRDEARATTEMEVRSFLAWCDNTAFASTELPYRRGDERWAGFTWRRTVGGDEFEARAAGTSAVSATGWRAILQQAYKQYPDCWPAAYALSRIYATAGAGNEALGLLNEVAKARTDWWAPYYALGQLYVYRRDPDQGVPILQRVVQLAPECKQARLNLQLLTNVRDAEDQ